MNSNNGVIRIGRKGLKKFAFGDAEPFEVDVIVAFQEWIIVDDSFRDQFSKSEDGSRKIPAAEVPAWHQAAVSMVEKLSNWDSEKYGALTVSEAMDFIARLREQYDELAVFFRPKSLEEPDSPDTSVAEVRFSEEES